MKAELIIENVGGLRGKNIYQFESGKLNIIKASNSGGKTSLIRGLTSILSTPRDGQYHIYFLKEAQKLGIKTDERDPRESFVNIHSKSAKVELKYEENSEIYEVDKGGDFLKLPNNGDQKFLLSGVLSGNTKILRQLDGVDEENEPDDFYWAVTKLSYADKYDEINSFLKTLKEDINGKKTLAEKKIEEISDLELEKNKLEKDFEDIENELIRLAPKFRKASPDLIAKRNETRRRIEDRKKGLGEIEGNLSVKNKEIEIKNKEIENIEKEIRSITKKLKEMDLENFKKIKEKKIDEINKEIETLKRKRNEIDGVLNLFQTAQIELRKSKGEVKCPLCNNGTISFDLITKKLDNLRNEKNSINAKILESSEEKNRLTKDFEKKEEEKKQLEKNLENKNGEKRNVEIEINKTLKISIEQFNYEIKRIKNKIEEDNEKLTKLRQGISPIDEEINRKYTEKEDEKASITNRISDILKELKQTSIEMHGITAEPRKAKKICEEWLEFISKHIEHCKNRAEEQRREASEKFNLNIKKLMDSLGFEEFRTVKLNNEYKLYVERLNPKTGDYVFQQVKSLSTSEKLSMALILQLALKETYIPNIPFFILDDIIEDFDDDRREKIFNYLERKAKDTGWFLIITKLVEEEKPLFVEVRGN